MLRRKAQGEQRWSVEEQKAYLRQNFADMGWETARVLDGMERSADFYLDVLRQVRMRRWSKGRIVLTGDAAWCVTPLGGIGATLAITGGYVLASEIARADGISGAFGAYERAMRPMVTQGQSVPKIAPRLLSPRSRAGIGLLHYALRIVSRPMILKAVSKAFGSKPEEPELGHYVM